MPPPLIQLTDIALTFGGTPLLDGVELSVSAGERVCLVGRNGSGKSTLLKIVAGPDRARPRRALRAAGRRRSATCRRSRIFPAMRRRWPMSKAGLGPTDDPHQARYLLEQLGLTGDEDPAQLSGGEARRAALAHVLAPAARHPAARRADQPSRSAGHRMAGSDACSQQRGALVLISHDRRFLDNLSRSTVWLDRGVTRRHRRRASASSRPGATSSWQQEEARAAQARPQDRRRRALAALRRDGAAQAQRAPPGRICRRCARRGATIAARPGKARRSARREADKSGTLVIEAKGIGKSFGERDDRRRIFRCASCAATASASSARTAAARPRWSAC